MSLCKTLLRRALSCRLFGSTARVNLVFAFAACFAAAVGAEELAKDYFANEIRPLLETHCVKCHSGPNAKAGLKLTNRQSLLDGGDSGSAINLKEAADSLLIDAINYQSYEMPPTGQLPQRAIGKLTKWVAAGAPWPTDQNIPAITSDKEDSHIQPPGMHSSLR